MHTRSSSISYLNLLTSGQTSKHMTRLIATNSCRTGHFGIRYGELNGYTSTLCTFRACVEGSHVRQKETLPHCNVKMFVIGVTVSVSQ